jgi:SAM-dependent methyltransferase
MMDRRETAPAAERNKQPILEVLARVLPATGLVLEIASGTGQHVAHFAKGIPNLTFQPSELETERHASIAAWIAHEDLANVRPPIAFDVTRLPWPVRAADAIVCLNMIHISPWEATLALMRGAGEILPPGGVLVTYGPYARDGAHTAPSNEAFDASLKARDPRWGVRDMEVVAEAAAQAGLAFEEAVPMPANNFTLVFRKDQAERPYTNRPESIVS